MRIPAIPTTLATPAALATLATLATLASLTPLPTAHGATAPDASSVVGGEPVSEGEWPDAVALVSDGEPFCSGTLIAPDLILTAAHCVYDGAPLQVRVDTLDGYRGPTTEVAEVHVHPDWETRFDAAVLVLANPIAGVEPRALVPECAQQSLVDGARVTVAGYGIRGLDFDAPAGDLYAADLEITSLDCPTSEGCNPEIRPNGELIAGGRAGVDSCFGDSGGPLYLRTEVGSFLAGVVSRATYSATADCGDGGIYVRADTLGPWIEETTGRRLPSPGCDAVDETTGGCNSSGSPSGGALLFFILGALALGIRRRR